MRISRWLGGAAVSVALIVALFAAQASTAGAVPAGARAQRPPTNINVSRETGNQSENAIAIQQTNPNHVVIVSNEETASGLFHGWSTDGGRTWQTNHIANGDPLGTACCDPALASDNHGNIFLTWLTASIQVSVAVSTDGGANFTKIAAFSTQGPGFTGAGILGRAGRVANVRLSSGDQPSITSADNEVWVTFTLNNGNITAQGASVTGLGSVGTFGAQEVPSSGHKTGDYGDVAIGPSGQVVIAWQDPTGGQGPATVYEAMDPDGLGPQGMGAGTAVLTSNVGGFDYIPAQSGRSVDIEVKLEYDRTGGAHDGRLYLLWTSEQPQESNDMDIQVQFSDDDGATWSMAVRVNDDATTNSQFNPKMAVDPTTGNLALAWYDCRNDKGDHGKGDTNGVPNDDAMVYGSVSLDGGVTFTPNRRISKGVSDDNDAHNGIDYGDYEGLAAYGGVYFYGWSDNSNSTGDNPDGTLHELDIYTARIPIR